ncbi:hypothetical protein BGZ67_010800, partial [Mortierella alpina]
MSRSTDKQASVGQHEDLELGDMSGQPHQSMEIQLQESVRELLESIPDDTVHQRMDTLVHGTVRELIDSIQEETENQHLYTLPDKAIREILESAQEEKAATTAVATPQISQPKRAQTLWQELECHCAMATEELGSLAELLRKSLGPRRAAASAKDEVSSAKVAYTRAIQDLEVYGQVDPSVRSELEQACVRYHDLLLQATQQPAALNTPFHDLENAYQDMNSVMQKVAD